MLLAGYFPFDDADDDEYRLCKKITGPSRTREEPPPFPPPLPARAREGAKLAFGGGGAHSASQRVSRRAFLCLLGASCAGHAGVLPNVNDEEWTCVSAEAKDLLTGVPGQTKRLLLSAAPALNGIGECVVTLSRR